MPYKKGFSRLKQKRFNALKKEATKQELDNKLEKLKKVNIYYKLKPYLSSPSFDTKHE